MAATHILVSNWSKGGDSLSTSNSYSGTGEVAITDETVADSVTDQEIVISIDVSALTAIYISSTRDMTLETNNAGTPVDTIALKANVPYVWSTDLNSYNVNKLATDVTALFLTNASGASATFNLRGVYDATP